LPADLRYTIYCTTIANGKDSDWLFLWNRYRNVQDSPSEKKNLLGALSCSTEIWTLQVNNMNQFVGNGLFFASKTEDRDGTKGFTSTYKICT
jgi:hypothetical protein